MNPFEQYKAVLGEATPIAERYLSSVDAVAGDLQQRIEDGRIRIMLFGAYNAGKSTLINALVGKVVAKVGDIPTTDKVEKFDWEGHVLLDTPGINAPIEHQMVSEAELERADLVLFVLRQEDQDSKDTIERLFHLLSAGRPIFLLLNYDNSDPEAIRQVREKLSGTLADNATKFGFSLDVLERLPVMLVKADSALKSRIENKQKLRESSGYDDFMLRFTDWLRQYDDEKQRLELVRERIQRELMEPVRKQIQRKLPGDDEADVLSLQIAHFQREARILRDSANNKARTEIGLRRAELSAALDQGANEQSVHVAVTQVANDVAKIMHSWLDDEVRLSVEKSLKGSLQAGGINLPALMTSQESSSPLLDKGIDVLVSSTKNSATPENIKKVLLLAREFKIPFIKGRWEKTLGGWAGKAAPVIQVVMGLVEVGMAHNAQEKANRQVLDAAMQRNQWVDSVCADMQNSLMGTIDEFLEATFDELLAPLLHEKEKLHNEADQVEHDLLDWEEFTDKILDARF